MRLSEDNGIVYVLKPGTDYEAGATGESINGAKYNHIAFLVQFGSLTGDAVLTVKSGASDGTQTTAETFSYRLASAAQASAGADVFAAWATSSALTLTAATYANKLLIVEIDVPAMTQGQPWLTFAFDAAASALNASVVAVLSEASYSQAVMPTALV
jgi:hypothetical protein